MQLVQRREVWLPTAWGWFWVLLLGLALGIALIRDAYSWLAVTDATRGQVLIVEGWMGPGELDEAASVFRSGRYARVITTGGPLHAWPETLAKMTFAERAAEYLGKKGVPAIAVSSPITLHDRTYLSAIRVRDWLQSTGVAPDAVDVVSVGPHARRSRLLYEHALGPKVAVGIIAVQPREYDPYRWWRSSAGARDMFDQASGLVWVKLFFRP